MNQAVSRLLAALILAAGISGTQAANLLSIDGGADLGIPSSNDVLHPLEGMTKNRSILSTTVANVRLEFFFWGSESGFRNTLHAGSFSHTEIDNVRPGGGAVPFPGFASPLFSYVQAAAAPVDLSFTSSGFGGELLPGSADPLKSIAFAYLTEAGQISADPTNIALITLDDSGAGPDDNHDDYVGYVRASAVPIPGAVWLFGSGLLALVSVGRRRGRQS
jgi:hypothetical protein